MLHKIYIPVWCHAYNLKNRGVSHLGLIFWREDGDCLSMRKGKTKKGSVANPSFSDFLHDIMQGLPFCTACIFKKQHVYTTYIVGQNPGWWYLYLPSNSNNSKHWLFHFWAVIFSGLLIKYVPRTCDNTL